MELGSISEERFRQETREKKDKARERILPVLSFCGIKGGGKRRLYFVKKHPNFMEKRVAADKRCGGKFYKSFIKARCLQVDFARLSFMEGDQGMNQDTFSYEARGAVLIIHLPRELDHHNCRDLKYETDLLLSENYVSRIVFDFSNTEFMDSSGIGILLNRYKQMAGSGGSVAICGAGAQVHRILNVGGLARLMPCFETKESAIAAG